MSKETVLCIRRQTMLDQLGFFWGFREATCVEKLLANPIYAERPGVEKEFGLKQIIPYMVFTCWINGVLHFLLFQRAKKEGGEVRLFDQYSIGWLGHINLEQDQGDYYAAVHREVHEELGWYVSDVCEPTAFINNDADEVGIVHLGLLHHMELLNPDLPEGEDAAIKQPAWVPWDQVAKWKGLEIWSKIALMYFIVKYRLQ